MTKDQLKNSKPISGAPPTTCVPTPILSPASTATPVLGLIFLKFADNNYRQHEADIFAEYGS